MGSACGRPTDLTNLYLTLCCYDLTSTFFERAVAPSTRFPSKAFGTPVTTVVTAPQVVIALLTTADGIPIAHHVFAGNTADIPPFLASRILPTTRGASQTDDTRQ